MKPLVWTSSLAIAAQLVFSAAPHPFGTPVKAALKLFASRPVLPHPAERTSEVLCGTLLMKADPKIDPRMASAPPTGIAFAFRTYPRPACGRSK